MKKAVSSYSFGQYLNSGRMSMTDVIRKAAEMGFEGIEFTELQPNGGKTKEDLAKLYREEAEKCGIAIVNYAVGANFFAEDTDAEIERVKKEVDIASLLGSPIMRHDVAYAPMKQNGRALSFDESVERLAASCRAVTEYAEKKGIRTCMENHGFFAQDSVRVEKLCTTVNHKNFGLLVDMGNFLCADEDPVTAVGRVAPYAFHVHAKDFLFRSGMLPDPGRGFGLRTRGKNYLRGTILGQGVVPVDQCLTILQAAGYDGFVSLEFEGIEDALFGIEVGLEKLNRCF